jgi:ABC-type branched-subunit amino acid transport system substrate-binding protein/serine/threonine protein kinase
MRCPRCSFDGELIDGACARCGYRRTRTSEELRNPGAPDKRSTSSPPGTLSGPLRSPFTTPRSQSDVLRSPSMPLRAISEPLRSPSLPLRSMSGPSRPLSLSTAKGGDTLNLGRYRLVDQLVLPDNQQGQGAAWLAIDTASGQTQVVIREVVTLAEERERKKQIVRQIALRLSEGTQHAGFPKILDVFDEFDNYFIVWQHIEGESLASLLRRQGGALPERTVAEYGRQLCEMVAVLARQQPPLVHGAINPETVIVSPDRTRVHLIHLPLVSPREPANASSAGGYKAPEQARGSVDSASDLYSVAATMHHAVTGFDPRERIAFFYPPARRLNPVVTQQMETILAQELRLSPPQRYARASDVQADLASLLASKALEPERKPIIATSSSDPLKLDMNEIRRRSQQRNRTQIFVFIGICGLAILFASFAYLLTFVNHQNATVATPTPDATATMITQMTSLNNEWQTEDAVYKSRGIGLSDGRSIFDTFAGRSAAEIAHKKAAALAFQKSDIATALSEYSQAVTNDKTDAEARIYYEDLQIQEQNSPFITIVLGVPLDSNALHVSIARPDLQAAYAFQSQVNTQNPSPLPGGAKLRILIGNSGAENSGAATIAKFVANRAQIGNPEKIVAVVGWPTSGESSVAYSILAGVQIPMITQTASSTTLTGASPYFFRVNPNDAAQGKAQGLFAYQTLGARNVLVLRDPSDPYSQSLADAFTTSFTQLGGKTLGSQADYFSEGKTTVEQFRQQIVNDALNHHVDLIFLPGFDVDGVRLAHALGLEEQMLGWSAYLSKLKILGGDGLDTSLILGSGDGADVAIAKGFPLDMQRLIFTSFADQSEWSTTAPPTFLTTWEALYGVASASNPNPPVPINTAIMVGDAFGVISYALKQVKGKLTGLNLRNALAAIGTNGNAVYQGLSGPISFGSDGNPVNKAVVLLEVIAGPNGQNTLKFLGTSAKKP